MKRTAIIQEISRRLDGICAGCQTKQQLLHRLKPNESKEKVIDRHCTKHCPIGAELKALGKQLGASDPYHPEDLVIHRSQTQTPNRKVM